MRQLVKTFLQLVILLFVIIALTVVWILFDGLTDLGEKADLALVADYSPNGKDITNPLTKAKLDKAAELLNEGLVPQVVVSGAYAGENLAPLMSRYLQSKGVEGHNIIEDSGGFTIDDTAHHMPKYLTDREGKTVMIIVAYYETTALKLALVHEGVVEVEKVHVGHLQKEDAPAVTQQLINLYVYVAKYYAVPLAKQVVAESKVAFKKAQDYAHGMKTNMDSKLNSMSQ